MPNHPPDSALNVVSDSPDLRDRYYEPSLAALKDALPPPDDLYILNQGHEGACTGFGLAATINFMYKKQNKDSSNGIARRAELVFKEKRHPVCRAEQYPKGKLPQNRHLVFDRKR